MKTRRIGTLTLGGGLVIFGGLFLAHLFFEKLDYMWIFRLWPLLFISLGLETLLGHTKEEWRYDKGAILLMFCLTGFAMVMALADFLLQAGLTYGHFHSLF